MISEVQAESAKPITGVRPSIEGGKTPIDGVPRSSPRTPGRNTGFMRQAAESTCFQS